MKLNAQGANLKVDGILGPLTTAAMNKAITTAVAQNPVLAPLTAKNDPATIVNAYHNGDWSSVVDTTGQPFSAEDQNAAVEKANLALAPGFNEDQSYAESSLLNSLGDKQNTYNDFLKTEASNFEADKQSLDQDAANKGVLFSGGRIQKEKNLKNVYEQNQTAKANSVGSDITKLGNDYASKYGSTAVAKPTLSQYYNLSTNTYNPNVARRGVGTGSLSSVYNPASNNYQGSEVTKNKSAVQVRAASLLGNKANKIVPYGYNNHL